MDEKKLSWKFVLPIGLMLFSFFFGAGNLIFPPVLGQQGGSNIIPATFGFCISAVGLPVLGVLVMAINNFKSPDEAGEPAGKTFAMLVTVLCALSIGPFFAIPRTCATSFSVIASGDAGLLWAVLYSVFYFVLTFWMVMKPSRVVDACGKFMAPLLIVGLVLLSLAVCFNPMGAVGAPQGEYATNALVKGVFEGYNTMDALCALLFGSAIIGAIQAEGIKETNALTRCTIYAGIIAGAALGCIYSALSFCGGQSVSVLGLINNGGELVSKITGYYFGNIGSVIVSAIFFLACITTSVGLVTSISSYFQKISDGKIKYVPAALGITIFSAVVANFGLTNIISYSIPMLVMLYPIIIVMIFLNILPNVFHRNPFVFKGALWLTALVSFNDGLCCAGIKALAPCFSWLPWYGLGLGWVCPALLGIVLGFAISAVKH